MIEPAPVGYYQWLDFNSPMTAETADRLVTQLSSPAPSRVLDIGCGWAEFLLRVLAANPDASGDGIDNDDVLIDRAGRNAAARGLADRVAFRTGLDDSAPADLVVNVGAEHVFGTLDQALERLWPFVEPGGRLFLGTMIWERSPTPEVAAAIGQVPTLPELIDAAVGVGWRPLGLTVAAPTDWDHFEFGYLRDWEQHVMAATNGEDADRARRAADEHRAGYLERRGVLGFAYLTLGRPGSPADVSP
ncbi:MAG: class I SAM-dependent methyltransferase [Actinomycetota bacterium]